MHRLARRREELLVLDRRRASSSRRRWASCCVVAGLCVDVNRFSLHGMYRDRLIRTFLGASRAATGSARRAPWPLRPTTPALRRSPRSSRRATPIDFIQFDRDDNPVLRWLAPGRAPPRHAAQGTVPHRQRGAQPRRPAATSRGRSARPRRSRSRRWRSAARCSAIAAQHRLRRRTPAASRSARRWRCPARRCRRTPARTRRRSARSS